MLFALFTLAGVPTSPILMIAYFSGECFLFFALFCDSFVNFNKKSSTKGKMYSKKRTLLCFVLENVCILHKKNGENLEQLLVDKWYYTAYNMR